MEKKAVSGIIVAILLASMLALASNIKTVRAEPKTAYVVRMSSENLLINGGFENGLTGWTVSSGGGGSTSATVVADGSYPDVLYYQRWNSENDGGSIHAGQENLDILVSDYQELRIELDVKVISNTLPNSGWFSNVYGGFGEFPARVLVNYEDANGVLWQWDHNFLSSDNSENYGRTNFEYIPRNTWVHYDSPNLVHVSTTRTGPNNQPISSPSPFKIRSIYVGGTGWDFSGMFDNVGLVGRALGDVNGDGTVTILDLILVSRVFGTSQGDPNYNPFADVNGDGTINILDMILVATHLVHHNP